MGALVRELRLGQFLVDAIGNYAHPLQLARDFVNLYANLGIDSHPFDLLPEGRQDVNVVRLVGKVNWHHIRLIFESTTYSPNRAPRQDRAALFLGHFVDDRDLRPLCLMEAYATIVMRQFSRKQGRAALSSMPEREYHYHCKLRARIVFSRRKPVRRK
jgi:hypothetical protein